MALNACQDKTALDQLMISYQEGLEGIIKSADSNCIIADHNQRGKCQAENISKENHDLVKETYQKYEGLKLMTAKFGKNAEELHLDICEVQDSLKAELDIKLNNTISALKELSKQIKVVNTAMCEVENATNDNCNSKQLNILNNSEKLNANNSNCWEDEETPPTDLEAVSYEQWLSKLCTNAERLTLDINQIIDISIHAASVNARLNFTSLKAAGGVLKESATGLGSNAQTCFTNLEKEFKESCAALVTAKEENSTTIFAERAAYTNLKGLKQFEELLNEMPAEECGDWAILEGEIQAMTNCSSPTSDNEEE